MHVSKTSYDLESEKKCVREGRKITILIDRNQLLYLTHKLVGGGQCPRTEEGLNGASNGLNQPAIGGDEEKRGKKMERRKKSGH